MQEVYSKPCKVAKGVTAQCIQHDFEPVAAAEWSHKAGSFCDTCSSCSSSISSCSSDSQSRTSTGSKGDDTPEDERASCSSAQSSTCSDQTCPRVPLWFHLRSPGRFLPWKKQPAKVVRFVRFYNEGA